MLFRSKSVAEISECVKFIDFEGTQTTYVDTDRNTTNDENRQDEVAVGDENTFQGQGVSDEEDRIKDEERDETHQQYPVKDDYEIKEETRNMEILFGINQKNNKQIYWEPNNTDKVFHTNTGIIGTMGTGKTQFTKSMITQLYRESKYNVNGEKVGILIFDYKGDYNKSKIDFIEATNANVYELYHLPFNPLSVIKAKNSKIGRAHV